MVGTFTTPQGSLYISATSIRLALLVLFVCLLVCVFACLFVCVFVCLPVCLFVLMCLLLAGLLQHMFGVVGHVLGLVVNKQCPRPPLEHVNCGPRSGTSLSITILGKPLPKEA